MNAFMFEIQRVQYLPHRYLFDDELIETWQQTNELGLYNIYFITTSKKARFDLDRTSTNMLGELKTYVRVGKTLSRRVVTHVHKCNPLMFQALHKNGPFGQIGTKFRIDRSASDERTLLINVNPDNRESVVPLSILIENVLEAENIQLGLEADPRIVYIGQSFRILDRLRTHKRINQTAALLKDDEELRINLVQFRTAYIGQYLDNGWKFFLSQQDQASREFRDKISLLERILISFFKPELNDKHVKPDLHDDRLVSEIVERYKIGGLAVGVGVHGPLGKFWSPRQATNDELVSYSFVTPSLGFRSGLQGVELT